MGNISFKESKTIRMLKILNMLNDHCFGLYLYLSSCLVSCRLPTNVEHHNIYNYSALRKKKFYLFPNFRLFIILQSNLRKTCSRYNFSFLSFMDRWVELLKSWNFSNYTSIFVSCSAFNGKKLIFDLTFLILSPFSLLLQNLLRK